MDNLKKSENEMQEFNNVQFFGRGISQKFFMGDILKNRFIFYQLYLGNQKIKANRAQSYVIRRNHQVMKKMILVLLKIN